MISHDHANVIVNTKKEARLADFLELVELIKEKVLLQHKVELELELELEVRIIK